MAGSGEFQDSAAVEYNPDEEPAKNYAEEVLRANEAKIMNIPGVQGIGIGRNAIGDDAITVYVDRKETASRLPERIEGLDVVVNVSGQIDAY